MTAATSDAEFERCLNIVLAHEGGFSRHPFDPGGATNWGITQKTLARARGRQVTIEDVRQLSKADAAPIYRQHYWNALRAAEMPAGVSLAVFDFAVNSGTGRAVRLLQKLLKTDVDGVVGQQTIEAAGRIDGGHLISRLTQARLGFLSRLATWSVFGRGWRSRVLSVERDALRFAAASALPQKGRSS